MREFALEEYNVHAKHYGNPFDTEAEEIIALERNGTETGQLYVFSNVIVYLF